MYYFIGAVFAIILIALAVLQRTKAAIVERKIQQYIDDLNKGEEPDETRMARYRENNMPNIPKIVPRALFVIMVGSFGWAIFNTLFFYAQPGYAYHVRTLGGTEYAYIGQTGWEYKGGGWVNGWKRALSIQAVGGGDNAVQAETEGGASMSASLPALNVILLDQVDADVFATARFRLPVSEEKFLDLAREYRSPENLIRTALIPAFKSTLQATASLMSAEEYFSGGRTEFDSEFENQMVDGIYQVKRVETVEKLNRGSIGRGSANAAKGTDQDEYGDDEKVVFKVEKQLEADGITPARKRQKFVDFGIEMVEARVVNLVPNNNFKVRMDLKQKASADRAIAREQRVQEEEQRLLAITRGEREVAERQAQSKVIQIEQTTNAETEKQLAITKALKMKEQAEIEKETAAIQLDKAIIDAKRTRTTADAEAHARKVKLLADNGLKIKLDTIRGMNKDTMDALAQRKVPTTVVYQGGGSENGLGTDGDIRTVAQTQMLKNLKQLDLDLSVSATKAR